jgi:hypothetical protein
VHETGFAVGRRSGDDPLLVCSQYSSGLISLEFSARSTFSSLG